MKSCPSKPEDSWVIKTCNPIGTNDDVVPLSRPPVEAIEAVRKLIMGYAGMNGSYMASNPMTKIHAPLVEAWRAAARARTTGCLYGCQPAHQRAFYVYSWILASPADAGCRRETTTAAAHPQ